MTKFRFAFAANETHDEVLENVVDLRLLSYAERRRRNKIESLTEERKNEVRVRSVRRPV